MQNRITLVAVGALLIGIIAGYAAAASSFSGGHMYGKGERHGNEHSPMHQIQTESMMGHDEVGMEGTMDAMTEALRGKTGDAFDAAFLSEMIVHHEGAVEMAELALTNANHQEVKDLATAIIAAQNEEIASMREWQTDWYGTSSPVSHSAH